MRQEHVTLKNVEVERLFELIKKHLQEIKLDIIHEETASPLLPLLPAIGT